MYSKTKRKVKFLSVASSMREAYSVYEGKEWEWDVTDTGKERGNRDHRGLRSRAEQISLKQGVPILEWQRSPHYQALRWDLW